MPSLRERLQQNYYMDGDLFVFTEAAHLARGFCCGNRCRHCPYVPRHARAVKTVAPEIDAARRADDPTQEASP